MKDTYEHDIKENLGRLKLNLYQGDCLEILPTLKSRSVDLVCCDMPYGTTNCRWDSVIDLPALWSEYSRVCKENAAILLFAQAPFDKFLGATNLDWLRYEIIWEKSHATGHLNAKKMPMKAHENILVFYRKLPTYNPIKTQGHPRKSATKRKDEGPIYSAQKFDSLAYDSTERYPRSVVKFASDKQKLNLHPTQKPVELIEWLINTYSNPGEVVLDNCMGSGTTGVACANTGRKFVGIEKEVKYFKIAAERLSVCQVA